LRAGGGARHTGGLGPPPTLGDAVNGVVPVPRPVIVDDSTGRNGAAPCRAELFYGPAGRAALLCRMILPSFM
jgi:hypothetical protein